MGKPTKQATRERAYAIWEQEGRPDGKDRDHWLRAEAEIISAASRPSTFHGLLSEKMTKFRTWLENWGKIVWPISIALILATGSVATANYCAQISGPNLVLMESTIPIFRGTQTDSSSFSFNWNNLGKKPALQGLATFLTISQDGHASEKLGEAPIMEVAGRNTIAPTFGYGSAAFDNVDLHKSGSFLVCTMYFDDTGKRYGQNFRFRLETQQNQNRGVLLSEPPSKNSQDCGGDFPGRNELFVCKLVHHLGL